MFENYSPCKVDVLLGKTLTNIIMSNNSLVFYVEDDTKYMMHHHQDCCENVYIEDVNGDLEDLVGSPILQAEEVVSKDETPEGMEEPATYDESYTWTFYKFATIKGYVTIRWFGTSNGYYSESVDFEKL